MLVKSTPARQANGPPPKYEGSWAWYMQQLREGKMTFEQVFGPRQPDRQSLWFTLGPCDRFGNPLSKENKP